jgi:hypothetical protein
MAVTKSKGQFECDQCDKCYKYPNGLKNHTKMKHSGDDEVLIKAAEDHEDEAEVGDAAAQYSQCDKATKAADIVTPVEPRTKVCPPSEWLRKTWAGLDLEVALEGVEDTLAQNSLWEEEEEECDYCEEKDKIISELKKKLAKAEKEIAQLKAAAKDPRDEVEVIQAAYKCKKKFTNKASLIAHTVLFHPKYTFPCQVCKKVFCKKDSLEKHRQVKCKSPAAPEIVLDRRPGAQSVTNLSATRPI